MCQLCNTQRRRIHTALTARIVPGCPDCGRQIAYIICDHAPLIDYVCLEALRRDDRELYEIVNVLAGRCSVGTEYWMG